MKKSIFFIFLFISTCAWSQQGSLKVANIFGDNMVIQQNIKPPVWGTALSGKTVSVTFAGTSVNTQTDSSGKWMLRLPPQKAGGPYKMLIVSDKDSILLSNVMVGEVWLASGQSNMQLALPAVNNSSEELKNALYPNIRFFTVKNTFSNYPLQDVEGSWKSCDPESARTFSAVAYFFARALHQDKNVAVGIISSSWGSTPSEAWTSADALSTYPDFADSIRSYKKLEQDWLKIYHLYQEKYATVRNANKGVEENVHLIDYDDSSWKKATFPLGQRPAGFFTWYRKIFTVASPDNNAYTLLLKNINGDIDVYLNGKLLKSNKSEKGALSFMVPTGLLRNDSNILAIRHIVFWEQGKMGDKKGDFSLVSSSDKVTILDGEWRFNGNIEQRFPVFPKQKNYPSALYNGMIAPLVPFGIKGVIWYQGENNSSRAKQYQTLFPLLINDWRNKWNSPDLPFLFVQLASFRPRNLQPVSDNWAMLREAQTMALKLPNTGMAVTIDIGDAHNIHPKNKQDVGMRLYLAAKKIAYGQNVVYSGPMYESMSVRNNEIVLSFKHIGSGLASNGRPLKGFAIAGEDHKFYWADAKIVGDKVVVSNPNVEKPIAVRYAWSTNPECNLYNKEHLPASPFRTDSW